MSVFLVSYELKTESGPADYQPLWDALNKLTSHKVQRSVWLVATTSTARVLHDHLKQFVDGNDRIWVSRVHAGTGSEHYYSTALVGTNDFLAKHL
ncbi:hypothetical protein SAMN06265370_1494 [Puniceibacterium sediminis]|uniref:CRISPR-associated protein Cas2 n=1 Tax=Puniceibacterium sediminis TaxID=1608407 RepID=A0A238ZXT6_9RHOB|nr:hypothetical protein SAMN06265370_1494 [Puniceibacterium sediminis]